MSERSGGAFDVTVGPVVRLWRRARRDRKMPAPERLAKARALVGSDQMRLDPKARTVQLLKPGMKLDLGGIAKGYASDEAIAVLKRHGIDRALVAGAGDIVVSGPPPGRDGWTIGIAPLEPPRAAPQPLPRPARTRPSRPRATPSGSSRSTASATRTSSTPGRASASSTVRASRSSPATARPPTASTRRSTSSAPSAASPGRGHPGRRGPDRPIHRRDRANVRIPTMEGDPPSRSEINDRPSPDRQGRLSTHACCVVNIRIDSSSIALSCASDLRFLKKPLQSHNANEF